MLQVYTYLEEILTASLKLKRASIINNNISVTSVECFQSLL